MDCGVAEMGAIPRGVGRRKGRPGARRIRGDGRIPSLGAFLRAVKLGGLMFLTGHGRDIARQLGPWSLRRDSDIRFLRFGLPLAVATKRVLGVGSFDGVVEAVSPATPPNEG